MSDLIVSLGPDILTPSLLSIFIFLAFLTCIYHTRGAWILRRDYDRYRSILQSKEEWKGMAIQTSRQSQRMIDSSLISHYAGLSIKNNPKHGLIDISVDRPTDIIGPHSGRVREMVPGDIMTMDESTYHQWIKRYDRVQESLRISRCSYCGTKQVTGTHCPNCGGNY